jgi:cytochrome c556
MASIGSANEMVHALRARYPKNAYVMLGEVGNATGVNTRRWIDVLVMGIWPSRGLEIIGIEIKVSRSDWLRELRDPAKADALHGYCDTWILAAGDASIVQTGELPKGWGLLVPDVKGVLKLAQSPLPSRNPKIDRGFIAAVLRRFAEQATPEALLEEARLKSREEGYQEGAKLVRESARYEAERYLQQLNELRQKVHAFEQSSQVKIEHAWNAGEIGKAVQQVMSGEDKRQLDRLRRMEGEIHDIQQSVLNAIKRIEAPISGTRS